MLNKKQQIMNLFKGKTYYTRIDITLPVVQHGYISRSQSLNLVFQLYPKLQSKVPFSLFLDIQNPISRKYSENSVIEIKLVVKLMKASVKNTPKQENLQSQINPNMNGVKKFPLPNPRTVQRNSLINNRIFLTIINNCNSNQYNIYSI